jgi:3-oxoadipate enol-lactonase
VPEAVALHYEVAGPEDGHAVLMGASLGTTLAMWDEQAGPLAERFRLLRFDHRGHGGSPVPPGPYEIADMGRDVLALLDGLGLERASYCGLSIGAMVGTWLAAHAPERVERLALVCTSAHLPPPEAWAERAREVEEAGTVEVVLEGVMARWLTPEFAAEHPEAVEKLSGMLSATSPEAYAGCCRALERMDLRPDLPRIQAPTLVVAAAQDPSTPPEHGEAVAAAIPGARFELLSPSAHIAAMERADDVNRLLLDHLAPAAAGGSYSSSADT